MRRREAEDAARHRAARKPATMTHELEARVAAAFPPAHAADERVVVAVSGGPDSVALLRALAALRPAARDRLLVAHFNHGWRGAESDADAAFVTRLADELRLPCVVGQAHGPAASTGPGHQPAPLPAPSTDEAAARHARYEFLAATAHARAARWIALGHTADDQAETVLHHVLRGTGLAGLAGMPRVRALDEAVSLARPLLTVRRAEVLDYLARLGQPYRTDATNADPRWTRNWLRGDLLPRIAARYGPAASDALLRLAEQAAEAQAALAVWARERADAATVRRGPEGVELDCRPLAGLPRHVVREALVSVWEAQGWPRQAMGFAEWNALAALAAPEAADEKQEPARPTARTLPGGVDARRAGDRLTLTRRA